jgi:hypothetical protein
LNYTCEAFSSALNVISAAAQEQVCWASASDAPGVPLGSEGNTGG